MARSFRKEYDPWKQVESVTISGIILELIENGIMPAPMLVQSLYKQNTGLYFCGRKIKEEIKTMVPENNKLKPYGRIEKKETQTP